MNSGKQNRSLAPLEKELDEKTRELNDKNAEYQELWTKHTSVLKEYRQCEHSLINEKSKLDDVNIQIQSLQSKVQTLTEDNKKLKSENDNLRQCLSRKEAEMEESERQMKQFIHENFTMNEQSEEVDEQVDEEMVEVKEDDIEDDDRTETSSIVISSDEEEEEEPKVLSQVEESPQESIQEETLSESAPRPIPESQSRSKTCGDHDYCFVDSIDTVVDTIFNTYLPILPNPTFSYTYWTMLRKKLREKDNYFRSVPIRCLESTFKNKVIYELYKNERLCTEEHRIIAFLAFEKYHPIILKKLMDQYEYARLPNNSDQQVENVPEVVQRSVKRKLEVDEQVDDDSRTEMQPISVSSDKDKELSQEWIQERPLPESSLGPTPEELDRLIQQTRTICCTAQSDHNDCSVDDIDTVVHYIFNIYRPIYPNPTYSYTYWTTLKKKLGEKNIYFRSLSVHCLMNTFKNKVIYELYKNERLRTIEHRHIALVTFQNYHQIILQELINQYDFARLPSTTDQQIAGMTSLASLRETKTAQRRAEVLNEPGVVSSHVQEEPEVVNQSSFEREPEIVQVREEPEVAQRSVNSSFNNQTHGLLITNLTHDQRRFLYDELTAITKKIQPSSSNK